MADWPVEQERVVVRGGGQNTQHGKADTWCDECLVCSWTGHCDLWQHVDARDDTSGSFPPLPLGWSAGRVDRGGSGG
jgi:hypothetical protein